MSKSKTKSRTFKAPASDLPNLADALFGGDRDVPGWVIMAANAKGRECINALLPHVHIAWREAGPGLPEDWRGFTINLAEVASTTQTNLPLEITDGMNLLEATPESLAFLLAVGVKRQGVRSAHFANGKLEILAPHTRQLRVVGFAL
jgi:hypothetical protein